MTRSQYIVAGIVVGGFLVLSIILFVPQVQKELPQWTQDNIGMVFIAWITQFATVVNYLFGSSKGSSDKNELLKRKEG
jgi:uncharacterized membrane protein YGL010W